MLDLYFCPRVVRRLQAGRKAVEVLQVARTVHSLISGQPVDPRTPPG